MDVPVLEGSLEKLVSARLHTDPRCGWEPLGPIGIASSVRRQHMRPDPQSTKRKSRLTPGPAVSPYSDSPLARPLTTACPSEAEGTSERVRVHGPGQSSLCP